MKLTINMSSLKPAGLAESNTSTQRTLDNRMPTQMSQAGVYLVDGRLLQGHKGLSPGGEESRRGLMGSSTERGGDCDGVVVRRGLPVLFGIVLLWSVLVCSCWAV